jgi:lysozyme family protein
MYPAGAAPISTSSRLAVFYTRGYSLFRYQYWRKTMSDQLENTPEFECTVCYAAHDEEIHQATLRIHRWFQHQVTHDFEDDTVYLPDLDTRLAAV